MQVMMFLQTQLKILTDKAALYSLDADLQLILGYQMLGLGDLDEAQKHLDLATGDIRNAPAANVLINLLNKMKAKTQIPVYLSRIPNPICSRILNQIFSRLSNRILRKAPITIGCRWK